MAVDKVTTVVRFLTRRWMSTALVLSSVIFAYRLYTSAPWYLNIYDFLIGPLLQFALPLSLLGFCGWLMPSGRWQKGGVPISFLISALLVLLFQTGWPEHYQPTTWEDSYTHLFVLRLAILGVCWPLWLNGIGMTLWDLKRKRDSERHAC